MRMETDIVSFRLIVVQTNNEIYFVVLVCAKICFLRYFDI